LASPASLLRRLPEEAKPGAAGASPGPGNGAGFRARRRLAPLALLWATGKRTIAVAALVALWEVLPRTGVVERTFLPPFSQVARAWWEMAGNGQLWENTRVSLGRSLAGLGIAVGLFIPLGLLIAWYKPVAEILNPVLELFRNTAPLALLPAFTLILGIGETSKVMLIAYSCAWPVLLSTISGVKGVDPLLVKSARSMGLGPLRLFQKVILPGAVPAIFTGVRLAGAYSILVLVAAEMVGAKAGLGYLINYAQFNFLIPQMYAGIVTISAIGLVVNQGLLYLERRFSTWRLTAAG
jgi:NitT/TauT family transport system permease protein